MVPFSSLFGLVLGAAGCGSLSGVRVVPAPAGGPVGVELCFFFRSELPASLFCGWLSARRSLSVAPVASASGRSFVVAVPVAGAPVVPPAALWLPALRGGSPRGLASLLAVALGAAA